MALASSSGCSFERRRLPRLHHPWVRMETSRRRKLCQTEGMARGWESKSVESQIESAEPKRSRSHHVPMNPEQLNRIRELDSLRLSRTRVLRDLQTANNPRYKEILAAALLHLDQKLAALE